MTNYKNVLHSAKPLFDSEKYEIFENRLWSLITCIKALPNNEGKKALAFTKEVLTTLESNFDIKSNKCSQTSTGSEEKCLLEQQQTIEQLYNKDDGTTFSNMDEPECSDKLPQSLIEYGNLEQLPEVKYPNLFKDINCFDIQMDKGEVFSFNFQTLKNMQHMYGSEIESHSEIILNLCSKNRNEESDNSNNTSNSNFKPNNGSTSNQEYKVDNNTNTSPCINVNSSFSVPVSENDKIIELDKRLTVGEVNGKNTLYKTQNNKNDCLEYIHNCDKLPHEKLIDYRYSNLIEIDLNKQSSSSEEIELSLDIPSSIKCDEALNLVKDEKSLSNNMDAINTQTSLETEVSMTKFGSCRKCRTEILNECSWIKHYSVCFMQEESTWRETHCNLCNFKITSKALHKKHMDSHQRNTCSKCQTTFSRNKALQTHMKMVHGFKTTGKNAFKCLYCNRTFGKKVSLYYHLQSHCKDGEKVCQTCGEFIEGEKIFENHMDQHLEKSLYRCDNCRLTFVRSQQYERHMKAHKNYVCKYCEQSLANKKSLFYHYKEKHPNQPSLIKLNKTYPCDLCPKVFIRPGLLQGHKLVHSGHSPYYCKDCNVSFGQKAVLRKHLRSSAHNFTVNGAPEGKYQCNLCQCCFPSFKCLEQHSARNHLSTPIIQCRFCEFKTKNRKEFVLHKKKHKSQTSQKIICEQCGSAFKCLAGLKEHFTFVHSNERRFQCPSCVKTFKSQSCLNRHIRIHSDERPYTCECGVSYKQPDHLMRHRSSTHSGSPTKTAEIETEVSDPMILSSEGTVLVENNSDVTPLFTVLDSQLVQLIPSSMGGTDSGGELHALSIPSMGGTDSGGELHALSIPLGGQEEAYILPGEMPSSLDLTIPIQKLDDAKNVLQLPTMTDGGSNLQFSNSLEILQFDTPDSDHSYLN